jgi:hypothetical protein
MQERPAFLRYVEIGKIAGETPALLNISTAKDQGLGA